MLYFVATLPSLILTIAALLLGIFSIEQRSSSVRWLVAGALILVAFISGGISAWQAHAQDAQIQALSRGQEYGFNNVHADIDALKAQTPRVPRLELHSSSQVNMLPLANGKTFVGLNLAITNDGDDVVFTDHYVVEAAPTTTDFGRRVVIYRMRRGLKGGTVWTRLQRNASQIVGINFANLFNQAQATKLYLGTTTAYFVVRFDVRSVTGLKKTLYYCSFYQGNLPVLCHDNTI